MVNPWEFRIRYWGATGSIAKPLLPTQYEEKLVKAIAQLRQCGALQEIVQRQADEQEIAQILQRDLPFSSRSSYGGNTTSIEIETPEMLILLDSGSGFRELGIDLSRRWNSPEYRGDRTAHVVLTHAHMDHTNASPFFDPYYDPRNKFIIWGTQIVIDSLNAVLSPSSPLKNVYFPLTMDHMKGLSDIRLVIPGESFQFGKTLVSTFSLNHPGGCLAYRFERGDRSIVFASDHEITSSPDRQLAEFAKGADLLYADAQYLQVEYEGLAGLNQDPPVARIGWGHSTVEATVATAIAAGVRHLHLGHHEPQRNDEGLGLLERYACRLAKELLIDSGNDPDSMETCLAYEGLTIEI